MANDGYVIDTSAAWMIEPTFLVFARFCGVTLAISRNVVKPLWVAPIRATKRNYIAQNGDGDEA